MWSLGCCLYALATGTDLFDPDRQLAPGSADAAGAGGGSAAPAASRRLFGGRANAGGKEEEQERGRGFFAEFDGNDSYLAQMVAVLGPFPREVRRSAWVCVWGGMGGKRRRCRGRFCWGVATSGACCAIHDLAN